MLEGAAPLALFPATQPGVSSWRLCAGRAVAAAAALQRGAQQPCGCTPSHQPISHSRSHALQLTHILNARDLAEAVPKLKPGRLFRSGSPAHASLEDVLLLRRELGVRCLLDFRSAEELAEDTAWSLMLSNGQIKTYGDYGQVVEVRRWQLHAVGGLGTTERCVAAGSRCRRRPLLATAAANNLPLPPLLPAWSQVGVDHNSQLAGVALEEVVLHRLSLMDRARTTRAMLTCAALSLLSGSPLPVPRSAGQGWAAQAGDVGMCPPRCCSPAPALRRSKLPVTSLLWAGWYKLRGDRKAMYGTLMP